METQSTGQTDSERLAQEHSLRIREMRKQHQAELAALGEKHQKELKGVDQAYQVELSAKKEEYERMLAGMQGSQASRLAQTAKQNEVNLKQAQETYRAQAEEFTTRAEKKLSVLREQAAKAEENINRKKEKGNA